MAIFRYHMRDWICQQTIQLKKTWNNTELEMKIYVDYFLRFYAFYFYLFITLENYFFQSKMQLWFLSGTVFIYYYNFMYEYFFAQGQLSKVFVLFTNQLFFSEQYCYVGIVIGIFSDCWRTIQSLEKIRNAT